MSLVGTNAAAQELPPRKETLATLTKVNQYFMKKYADYRATSHAGGVTRPSNIWTRGVYYEGLMALYAIHPREEYYRYAYDWAEFHQWGMRNGTTTRNADDQCCGQTYIDLYRICPQPEMIRKIKANIDMVVNTPQVDDWWWIDAVQMAMPIYAKLGALTGERKYYDKMWQMYSYTRDTHGDHGMYNAKDALWWRDQDFDPPYREPNGEDCYWSRGNGWVYAALVRVLQEIPADEAHRADYIADFRAMSHALKACQRADGYWNVSLHDASNFGGKEASGTALFVYGMAYGVRTGLLDREEYLPVLLKAWNAMARECVHPDTGFLGYVQGTGKEPKDGQPVTYRSVPDFEDYGIGCFLLAGTEVYKL
ncbi:MAG: glycoside hydrolase family 88 protein [Mediterranea sp.]|jgi:rhamnogalacturonyl hydrolase YesR|nr:glycoside hydrolase family 88 protein [Mediterranea sp.]